MTLYAVSPLIASIFLFLIGLFVFLKNRHSKINQLFFQLSIIQSFWTLGCFIQSFTLSYKVAIVADKLIYACVILFPIFLLLFTKAFCGQTVNHKKIFFLYLIAFLFLIVNFLDSYRLFLIKDVVRLYDFRFIATPSLLLYVLLFYVTVVSSYAFLCVILLIPKSTGLKKAQLKYLFFAYVNGASGIFFYFLLVFKIPTLAIDNFFEIIYASFLAYAIVKYRLMDISVAITRIGIFVFTYALVLGIPFFLGFKYNLWQYSTGLMLILATAGPYIYMYLQKGAEKQIFQEEYRYRQVLREASYGMIHIKETDKLASLIVHIISKSVRANNCLMFLLNKETGHFDLKASRNDEEISRSFKFDSKLIKYIEEQREPVVCEELKQKNSNKSDFKEILEEIDGFKSELILPMLAQDNLFAVIMIGKKKSGKLFNQDDILVFSILANQVGIAIENCLYWEDAKKRMREEDFQARVASLDMMASSFAHEIDNPIQGIMGQIDCINDDLEICNAVVPSDIKDNLNKSFDYVLTNVKRISSMIKSVLEYSRMTSGDLVKVSIYDVVDGFENLMTPQFKKENVKYYKEIESDLPEILAEKIQIEEILMNFATNSMHAVRNNNQEKKIYLKIFRKNSDVRIEFSDNGYGIPEKLIKDVFLASVTTKGSSEGTGLGLYRCRRIIEAHKGKLWAESKGKDKGATMIVELRVFAVEQESVGDKKGRG